MALSAKILRELLDYDPSSGRFMWRHRRRRWFTSQRICSSWNTRYAGSKAGCIWIDPKSGATYWQISVLNKRYLAHRLAVLWMTGRFPPKGIDHKNRDGTNNRWTNLRPANQSQNMANRGIQKNSTTMIKGVTFDRRTGTYKAQITVSGRNINIGRFVNKLDAGLAYRQAAEKHFGEFASC